MTPQIVAIRRQRTVPCLLREEIPVREEYKALLTPWKIGNCEIKNRFVVTSMGGTDLFG